MIVENWVPTAYVAYSKKNICRIVSSSRVIFQIGVLSGWIGVYKMYAFKCAFILEL
jgi:hypothetical protein